MYEEMVETLRDEASVARVAGGYRPVSAEVLDVLADAIEKLSKRAKACKGLESRMPRWIPVTEKLPEDGSLVGKLIADSDGAIRIAGQCAVITLSGGKTVYTDLVDLVSFLAEDTPTAEWEDCTHITHWMPLPDPPKEEAK